MGEDPRIGRLRVSDAEQPHARAATERHEQPHEAEGKQHQRNDHPQLRSPKRAQHEAEERDHEVKRPLGQHAEADLILGRAQPVAAQHPQQCHSAAP